MKYVLIRCEDRARPSGDGAVGLLEAAKLTTLQHLAQTAAVGVVAADQKGPGRRSGPSANGLQTQWLWWGYRPEDVPAWQAGQCYAASLKVELDAEDTVWCCELVTQHDGRLIDPTAGRIPTNQASTLIQTLQARLGTSTQRWMVGDGSHHVLLVRDPEWQQDLACAGTIPPPEGVVGHAWRRALPRHTMSKRVAGLIEASIPFLDHHEINKVRVDLGENPANMIWLWGGCGAVAVPSFSTKTGLSGALIARGFPSRGLAHLLSLKWHDGPARLDESGVRHVHRALTQALASHDVVSVHLPIDQHDPVERQCLMDRLDQLLVSPLTEHLMGHEEFRCVIAIEDRVSSTTPFVAAGTGLPPHPVVRLTHEAAARSPLKFLDGAALIEWFLKAA